MFKNILRTSLRDMQKSKAYSAINIIGLAGGLSSFIIILLFLNYELRYDKWSPELNKVFRVSLRSDSDILPHTPAPLASFLGRNYPNAEFATSIQPAGDFEILLATDNKKIYQKGLVMADSSFLKVFPYRLLKGNSLTALNSPNSIILSEELSNKLFGTADPIGRSVKMFNAIEGVVTGVFQMPKTPSHLNIQLVARDPNEKQSNFWENYSYQTYIKVKSANFNAKIEDEINRLYYNERLKQNNISFEEYKRTAQAKALFIDAVPKIHNFPTYGVSNFTTLSILLILAILLLLAGAINFSNLTIAKSIVRAKEVGVRKVLGSGRKQLILQFMSETGVQCLVSLMISIVIVYASLPYINKSFNVGLSFWQQDNTVSIILQISVCLAIVILLSGLYPSLFLSRFNPTKVLKGDYSSGKKGKAFRNTLIVLQFMVSAFFIIAALIISRQMDYMENKDKGFSDSQVLRIEATQDTREKGFDAMKNHLNSIPGIAYVAKTTNVPGDHFGGDTSTIDFKYAGKEHRMSSVKISTDYFNTLQIDLVKGRFFLDKIGDQQTRTAIINETAADMLNITSPMGQTIYFPYCDSVPVQIVGIVKDFNVRGFESRVQPVVFTIGNNACMYQSGGAILVKLTTSQLHQSVASIEQVWKKIEPEFPIRYSFLEENFQQLFVAYTRLQKIITFFAAVAVLISVMGLFALTAFSTRQRTKEIGVRKVLGATVIQLGAIMGKEFIYLVMISILVMTPIAWWAMNKWLEKFAYHIDITWWIFVMAGMITMLIALVAVGFQAIKAAVVNPVKSLRTE